MKVVNDQLVELMGSAGSKDLNEGQPQVILMAGLQVWDMRSSITAATAVARELVAAGVSVIAGNIVLEQGGGRSYIRDWCAGPCCCHSLHWYVVILVDYPDHASMQICRSDG